MSEDAQSTARLIDAIEDAGPLEEHRADWVKFMLASAELIAERLPDVGRAALETARRFWNGQADAQELEDARVRSWKYLEARGVGTSLDEPDVCALRAVICLLYPDTGGVDFFDLVHFFVEVTQKVTDIGREQCALLRSIFASQLAE